MKPMMKIKVQPVLTVLVVFLILISGCKKVPFYAGEGAILVLTTDKTVLKAGGEQAKLTVTGFDSTGQVLHDHTTIIFSTSLGQVEPSEIEMRSGIVTVEFISGDRSGVAEITARSGSITAEPNPLQIVIGSAALEVLSISASPSALPAGGGRSCIRAYAFDAAGNLLEGIPLLLSSTSGYFEKNLSVYYTDAGGMVEDFLVVTETASVKVESSDKSAEIEISVDEEVENELPTADFSISPTSPTKGEPIHFNGSLSKDTDGHIVSFNWDFGDGSTGKGETVDHIYNWADTNSRTFTVVLKVTDDRGGEAVIDKQVTVQ
jgi:hypothetical protein